MLNKIFDTHAHYDDEAFDTDRDILIRSLKESGIINVVNVGASIESCKKTIEVVRQYDFFYGALGVHPSDTAPLTEEDMKWLHDELLNDKTVAVGEIGLDYYWDEPSRDIQKKWFVRQLELAREVNKPVIIHSRDAAADTLDIMKAEKCHEIGGVIHCFSYSKEMAREYLDMGFYIGIGGVVTFNNAKKVKEVAEYVPLESIVLETDCPYLAPVPNRGKRNSSINLPYVVDEISRIKGIEPDEVINQTYNNALRLYRI